MVVVSNTDSTSGKWTPPYASWVTLQNTVERMADEGAVPARIDRSYLSKLPGSAQSELMAGMKALGLIDDEFKPQPALEDLVAASEDDRKKSMREIIERLYAAALALGPFATQAQLEGVFRTYGVSGSTLRKAVRFFLNASKFADVPLSPHFRAPRLEASERKPRTPKGGRQDNGDDTLDDPPPPVPLAGAIKHPFIQGLVKELPEPGAVFPEDTQEAWFATARGIFKLIYKTDAPDDLEPRVTRLAPEPGGGESG